MRECVNCVFSENIDYGRETVNKMVEHYNQKIVETKDNPRKTISLLHYLDMKRTYQMQLIEMDEMLMCRRFPNAVKTGKKNWCGEFKENLL